MRKGLQELAKEKIIIVAHRGTAGGNIPCNTIPAYRTAVSQGADMIEIDVDKSADGELFIFHPGMENPHLRYSGKIGKLTAEEVRGLRYVNYDGTPTQFPLNTLDEVLEEFRGKCFINVDKFWSNPEQIYKAVMRHGMIDQVVVKAAPGEGVLKILRELAPDIPFMPIVRDVHPMHAELMSSGINYVGAEVLFKSEDAEVASERFIDMMHRDGKLVWVNSIIYNWRDQLSAGHSDDTAICESPDLGWGWLARRGFDFIQTDWVSMLSGYLKENDLMIR